MAVPLRPENPGNVSQLLRDRSLCFPTNGFVAHGVTTSYATLWRRVDQYGAVLLDAGVLPGDRVVVQVQKSIEAVALYLGCLQVGAVYVPLNTAYGAEELAYFVRDADPSVLVIEPDRTPPPSFAGRVETLGDGRATLVTRADSVGSSEPFADVFAATDSDPAAILYTSGTTGRSKGAVLTHANLRRNAIALHDEWGFASDDTLLHILPIFHVHGLFVALHCALLAGCNVLFHERFSVGAVIDALPMATVMMGVPTHYARLAGDARFDEPLTRTIRLFTSGSAPMTETLHTLVHERTGQRVLERYGMSEAGIITSNPLDGDRIAGTVGYPLRDVELRVVDDDGQPTGSGVAGSVEIRGPHLFAGYWRRPDATAVAHRPDGFFVTGDIGAIDDGGRLTLEGRSGDMIISGGYNVYPKEIELVLDQIEGVAESAVVGAPDSDLGESVVAFVVGSTEESVLREALSRCLAPFKQPAIYRLVDVLPRNAMGKVEKHKLRAGFQSGER